MLGLEEVAMTTTIKTKRDPRGAPKRQRGIAPSALGPPREVLAQLIRSRFLRVCSHLKVEDGESPRPKLLGGCPKVRLS
jgi:hypothetical protein